MSSTFNTKGKQNNVLYKTSMFSKDRRSLFVIKSIVYLSKYSQNINTRMKRSDYWTEKAISLTYLPTFVIETL